MLQGRVNAVVLKRSHGLLNFLQELGHLALLLSPFDAEPSIMMSFLWQNGDGFTAVRRFNRAKLSLLSDGLAL